MVVAQWVSTGAPPNSLGVFSNPPYLNDQWSILWVSSLYLATLNLPGDIYWIVYITPQLMALMIGVSVTTGLLVSEIVFLSRELRGSCKLEKSMESTGAVLAVTGTASITSSAIACPSCGFTFFTTLASAAVASVTGSTLGMSALAVNLAQYSLTVGLLINVLIIYIVSGKIAAMRGMQAPKN
jgi:uncharacterized membrane protein